MTYSANGMESGTARCIALPWTQDRPLEHGALCAGRSEVRALAALPPLTGQSNDPHAQHHLRYLVRRRNWWPDLPLRSREEIMPMTRAEKLVEPCPFCASEQVTTAPDHEWGDTTWDAICKACGARVRRDLEEQAIAAWNTRASIPTPEASEQLQERVPPRPNFDEFSQALLIAAGLYSDVELAFWLTAPQPLLDMWTPVQLLARGEAPKLLQVMQQIEDGVYI